MTEPPAERIQESQVPRWLAVSKDVVQIAAMFFAGVWAIFYYRTLESPDNFDRLVVSLKAPVDAVHSEQCFLRLQIEIKNAGKSPFRIDKQTVSAWVVQVPSPEHPDIQYFDVLKWRAGDPILTLPEPGSEDWPLFGRYPSGASDIHTLGFRVKQGRRRVVLFVVETAWTLDGVRQKDQTTWTATACPPVTSVGNDRDPLRERLPQVLPEQFAPPTEPIT